MVVAQRADRAGQMRLDRSLLQAHDLGNFFQAKLLDEAQHEYRALLLGERCHQAHHGIQLLARDQAALGGGGVVACVGGDRIQFGSVPAEQTSPKTAPPVAPVIERQVQRDAISQVPTLDLPRKLARFWYARRKHS